MVCGSQRCGDSSGLVKSVVADVPKCAENSLYKQLGLVFVLAFIQLPNTIVSSLGKGNEGPRLLPEIASLVNVWLFVCPCFLLLAVRAGGCGVFF